MTKMLDDQKAAAGKSANDAAVVIEFDKDAPASKRLEESMIHFNKPIGRNLLELFSRRARLLPMSGSNSI